MGGKRGVVMLLRLRWRHQCLLRLRWRHQCWLWLRWRHKRRLLLRLRLMVLKSVEVVVGLRGRHEPTVRVAVLLLLLRVVVIHLYPQFPTPAGRGWWVLVAGEMGTTKVWAPAPDGGGGSLVLAGK